MLRQRYDNIANRGKSRIGTGSGTPVSTYGTNLLNQYEFVTQTNPTVGQGYLYDDNGNMSEMYYVGDIDGDGDTDITDLGLILSAYGTSTCASPSPLSAEQFDRADIDGDCVIGISDYTMLLGYFGVTVRGKTRRRVVKWPARSAGPGSTRFAARSRRGGAGERDH